VLGRAVHELVPPIGLAFWRWAVASLLILPFVWPAMQREWPLLRAHLVRLLILAALGVSGFNTCVYLGLQTTSATNSVLIQSTLPLLILLLNRLLFDTVVGLKSMISILLSLAGVLLILGAGNPLRLAAGQWNPGDLWVFAAAWIWALYSVLLRWRPAGLTSAAFLGFTVLAGCVLLSPAYVLETALGRPMVWSQPVILAVAYVAVFPSALAYLFWNRGVATVGANAAGHFVHLMPVFGSAMAIGFLGEAFHWYHLVGALLVAVGILLTLLRRDTRSA